ncbi:penicillin acylase family protein [Actinoplanes sp. NPDC026670]|uniref:penicillin acylase family protein n=1 Tax=Actinoplanes sp. NPDC026670 TaxID=3154700 RepID=UPI0034011E61
MKWSLAALLVVVLTVSAVLAWVIRRSFPDYDSVIIMPGLMSGVTAYRDDYGIPHLYASNQLDLFRAQGYVHAQDRFWEMDFRRHLTSGRLAEMFGPSEVPTDAFLRTLGWHAVAEREWELLTPDARANLEAYASGVNAWMSDNGGAEASGAKSLEYALLGLQNPGYTVEPWSPIDSIALLKAMAWDLVGNIYSEMDRSVLLGQGLTRTQIEQLFPVYPYDRNAPIVAGGSIINGVFAAKGAPAGDSSGRGGGTTDPAWRDDAAPTISALRARITALPGRLGVTGTGVGSNSWVVSGDLTASGKPLLANDPHLGPSLPGIWYQNGLHCSCGHNAAGFSLAGLPGLLIGHNDRITWGLTNLGADVTDLYIEKIDDDRYFDGTTWQPLTIRDETITVAGGEPVTVKVRSTKHGPLLSDRMSDILAIAARPPLDPSASPYTQLSPAPTPSLDAGAPGVPAPAAAQPYAVALRWTALDPGRTIDAMFDLNRASNWTEFRAAAALFDAPAQNLIYADVDGNIGYQAPGKIPVRGMGDGRWPAPGWDPAYDWTGTIPFPALPNEYNPDDGMIVTANQAATGPQYPYLITNDWSHGYRSHRIADLITDRASRGKLTVDDMRAIQMDNYNGFAPTLVPALLAAPLAAGTEKVAAARDLLRGWDFQQPAETPATSAAAAAFYNATLRHLMLRTFDELPTGRMPGTGDDGWETLRPLLAEPGSPWWDDKRTPGTETMNDMLSLAMNDAEQELTDRLGDNPRQWRWGDLHTLALENGSLGQSGITPVEMLFNRGPVPAGGGGGIVNATSWTTIQGYEVTYVPSMRMITDLADLNGSRWIQLTGASGHAFHRNYTDQVDLWRTGQDTPMLWNRPDIESAAEHTSTMKREDAK